MTDEELLAIYKQGFYTTPLPKLQAGLRAVYNAGLTRAAEIARAEERRMTDYGNPLGSVGATKAAAAIDAEKEKN